MTTLRLGIIGCGNVTLLRHLPALLATPGIVVQGAADPILGNLHAVQEAAGLA